jgi:DNA-3-methyladenine glycosylase II
MSKGKRLSIPFSEDLNFGECCWYLDRGYDDCMHVLKGDTLLKAERLGGEEILFSIRADKDALQVAILRGKADGRSLDLLREYIQSWFDLSRDLRPFYALLKKDRRLAYMETDYRGLRLVGIVDLFETLCWSIIGQQINLTFAYTLKRRLVEKYGSGIHHEGVTYHLFPTCERLAAATVEDLRALQFSRSKAEYLIGLANSFVKGELSREQLMALPDTESRLKVLTGLRGIGVWTANYSLMKSLRDPGCIPHGDTGLLTGLANHGIIRERTETEKISRFFSKYRGWESYLVFYLWRSLSVRPV